MKPFLVLILLSKACLAGPYASTPGTAGSDAIHRTDETFSFWANDDGAGFVRLRKAGGNFKTFEGDFGKSILHYFHFDTNLINDVPALPPQTRSLSLQLYPNPADDQLFFKLLIFAVSKLGCHKFSLVFLDHLE